MWCGLGLVGFTRFLLEQTNPVTSSCPLVTSPPICDSWATSPSNLCRFQRSIKHNNPTKQVIAQVTGCRAYLEPAKDADGEHGFRSLAFNDIILSLLVQCLAPLFFKKNVLVVLGTEGQNHAWKIMQQRKLAASKKAYPAIWSHHFKFPRSFRPRNSEDSRNSSAACTLHRVGTKSLPIGTAGVGPTTWAVVMSWAERMFQGFKLYKPFAKKWLKNLFENDFGVVCFNCMFQSGL